MTIKELIDNELCILCEIHPVVPNHRICKECINEIKVKETELVK